MERRDLFEAMGTVVFMLAVAMAVAVAWVVSG